MGDDNSRQGYRRDGNGWWSESRSGRRVPSARRGSV